MFCRVKWSAAYSGVRAMPECSTANALKQISCVRGWSFGLVTTGRWPAAKCWGQAVSARTEVLASTVREKARVRSIMKTRGISFKGRPVCLKPASAWPAGFEFPRHVFREIKVVNKFNLHDLPSRSSMGEYPFQTGSRHTGSGTAPLQSGHRELVLECLQHHDEIATGRTSNRCDSVT